MVENKTPTAAQGETASNRANTGGTDKKTRLTRVGISMYGGAEATRFKPTLKAPG
jgi:hypothetical protein